MAGPAFYEFRAPKFVEFSPTKLGNKSAYFDVFDNENMDIDITIPLPSESGIRWSSTPNKRDSCTQTPSEKVDEAEGVLSDALDNILHLERPKNRRSVRFNEAVDVYPPTPNSSVTDRGRNSGSDTKGRSSGSDSNKRQMTPIVGQTWHQALKYRSVEQRVATPKPGTSRRASLLADPTLKLGASRTPSSIPRPIQVKVRVDPKPVVKVEPFQLTTYKPRQSPLEDPVKFFQRSRDTPTRQVQAKPAVRRLPLTENKEASPKTQTFRARPPVSLYQKPFVPRPMDRPPIKTQPFRLHTEERAKKREEYDHKIQQHLLELEVERQRIAAERERQEALELKELRRVKIHARPVPAFVYSPVRVETSPRTPSAVQRPKNSTNTI